MRRSLAILLLAAAFLSAAPDRGQAAPSSEIMFRVTRVRDSIWRYDYSLVNRSTAPQNTSISLFATFFPYGSSRNIGASLVRAADGWRARTGEPANDFAARRSTMGERADDGFYVATARSSAKALRAGQTLSGFSVEFEWLGPDLPGEQDYLAIHTLDKAGPKGPSFKNPPRFIGPGQPGVPNDALGGPIPVRPGQPVPSYYEEGRTRLDPSVPEPMTVALLGSGLVGFAVTRLRRRKNSA